MRQVLITGATGVLGSRIVPYFLAENDSELHLIIRANSPEHLQERFIKLLAFWKIDPNDHQTVARIKPLLGDISEKHFGLEDLMYKHLARSVSCVVHCATDISMNLPIAEARRGSVFAAKNIIDFALTAKLVGVLNKLEVISTVGVAGRQKKILREQPLPTGRRFHNTYEQAKAEAEQLFFAAHQAGVPITIHRPSMIVGDSETGEALRHQVFFYLCRFLSGRITKSLLPNMRNVRLDIIPVDYVAKAIYLSSLQADSTGRVFHLCSGPQKSIEIKALINLFRDAWAKEHTPLPNITYVPMPIFRFFLYVMALTADQKEKRALGSLSIFLEYAKDRQSFDNTDTDSYLSKLGLSVPNVESYIDKVFSCQLAKPTQKQSVAS